MLAAEGGSASADRLAGRKFKHAIAFDELQFVLGLLDRGLDLRGLRPCGPADLGGDLPKNPGYGGWGKLNPLFPGFRDQVDETGKLAGGSLPGFVALYYELCEFHFFTPLVVCVLREICPAFGGFFVGFLNGLLEVFRFSSGFRSNPGRVPRLSVILPFLTSWLKLKFPEKVFSWFMG